MCTVLNLQGNMSISYNNFLICVTSFTTRIIKILNVSALLATPYIMSLLGPITSQHRKVVMKAQEAVKV